MSKRIFTVSYRIIATVEAESLEEAIEQIEDHYEPLLDSDHAAFVSAEEETNDID